VIAGIGGAASVIAVNAWMNTPQGFELGADGRISEVDVSEVLFNPSFWHEFPHMWLAAYMVAGFLVASVYAVGMLRGRRDRYHRLGFLIPFTVAAIAAPIQVVVGDFVARDVFEDQPVKFAAMECVYETGEDQAEHLGGICTDDEVKGAISIPGLNSLLAGFSTDTEVEGLNSFPSDEHPPALTMIHLSFDVMVGIGFALLALAAWFAVVWYRRRELPGTPWFLRTAALSGVASVIALEAGWVVTEVGRQPWIVSGYMRTEDAVTPAEGIWWVFGLTMAIYLALGVIAGFILRAMARRWREADAAELDAPYSPRTEPPTGPGEAR